MRKLLLASCLFALPLVAHAQTTVQPGTVQQIPNNAIFVNPTGQDTFVTGGANQTVTGNTQRQTARGGRATATNNVTVNGAGGAYQNPPLNHYAASAPAIFAPNLTTSNDTCSGSWSAGGSGSPFAFLFGKTYAMEGCETRAVSNQAARLGRVDLAQEVMCDDHRWREAAKRLGQPCAADRPTQAATVQQTSTLVEVVSEDGSPDWCDHLSSASERRTYAHVCHLPVHPIAPPRHRRHG